MGSGKRNPNIHTKHEDAKFPFDFVSVFHFALFGILELDNRTVWLAYLQRAGKVYQMDDFNSRWFGSMLSFPLCGSAVGIFPSETE